MPVFNERAHLPETLASIAAQRFDRARMQLVVVDGGSTDGSREFVADWFVNVSMHGVIVDNPRRRIPIALNLGAAHAGPSDIIIRLDAHTVYDESFVADTVSALETADPLVGEVGPAQIPDMHATFEHQVVGAILIHPIGLARLGVTDIPAARPTETVYLGSWKPGVLHRLGGFDERFAANEDSELEARLRKYGWRILLIPAKCSYKVNRSVWKTIRQWGNYGFWRAQTTRRFPDEFRFRHLLPPLFVLAGFALLISPWRLALVPVAALYALGMIIFRGRDIPFAVGIACAAIFPLVQAAWGIGFLRGIIPRPPPFIRVLSL
jgi:succinoglycan biosynthesis protein ExoA